MAVNRCEFNNIIRALGKSNYCKQIGNDSESCIENCCNCIVFDEVFFLAFAYIGESDREFEQDIFEYLIFDKFLGLNIKNDKIQKFKNKSNLCQKGHPFLSDETSVNFTLPFDYNIYRKIIPYNGEYAVELIKYITDKGLYPIFWERLVKFVICNSKNISHIRCVGLLVGSYNEEAVI